MSLAALGLFDPPTQTVRNHECFAQAQVGWPCDTAVTNAWRGLQQSQYVSILLNDEGKLAGLARATSDLAYNAQICDVVVHPDYQVTMSLPQQAKTSDV